MSFAFIRLHFLLAFALTGAYITYFPIYISQLGLSDAEIGWVFGVYGVAMAFMPIVSGHLADRHLSNRSMLAICYVGVAAALWGVCTVATGFVSVLLLFGLFSIAFTPLFTLIGGLTFAAMHEEEDAGRTPPSFHRIRLWGSWGFILPGFAFWWLLDKGWMDERGAVYSAAVIAVASALLYWGLPRPVHHKPAANEPDLPSAAAWQSVVRPPVRSAVGSMVLLFIALTMLYAFFTRYLDEMGVASEWFGVIVNIGVVVEIGCIWCSAWFVRVFGFRGVMLLGAACMVARMVLLAMLPTVGVALGTQILHGPVVMLLYVLAPLYLNHKAGRANRNSMQGLYSVLCFGVARITGSIAGGQMTFFGGDDALLGLQYTFALAAALCLIAFIWLFMRFRDEPAEAFMQHSVQTRPNVTTGEPET